MELPKKFSFVKEVDVPDSLEFLDQTENIVWNINSTNFQESHEMLEKILKYHPKLSIYITTMLLHVAKLKLKDEIEIFKIYFDIARKHNICINPKILSKYFDEIGPETDEINIPKYLNIIESNPLHNKDTLIHSIAYDDIDKFIEYSSQSDFDLDNRYGRMQYLDHKTPIDVAAFYGSVKVFKYLLQNNAQIDWKVSHSAICGGNYEIIHIIEQNGEKYDNDYIFDALEYHRNELIDYLLENYRCKDFSISRCLENFNIKAALFSFYNGDDINKYEQNRFTTYMNPFSYASKYNILELMNFLVENGADVNSNSYLMYWGNRPINFKFPKRSPISVAIKNLDNDILRYLIAHGADVNQKQTMKKMPLFVAIKKGNKEAIDILLENNYDINKKTYIRGDKTPLMYAIKLDKLEMFHKLLDSGADPLLSFICYASQDEYYNSLTFAIKNHKDSYVQILLEKGIDPNEPKSNPPLQVAINCSNIYAVRLLIEYHAEIKRSYLDLARKSYNEEIIKLIRENIVDDCLLI